jgi:hypothetical protein
MKHKSKHKERADHFSKKHDEHLAKAKEAHKKSQHHLHKMAKEEKVEGKAMKAASKKTAPKKMKLEHI